MLDSVLTEISYLHGKWFVAFINVITDICHSPKLSEEIKKNHSFIYSSWNIADLSVNNIQSLTHTPKVCHLYWALTPKQECHHRLDLLYHHCPHPQLFISVNDGICNVSTFQHVSQRLNHNWSKPCALHIKCVQSSDTEGTFMDTRVAEFVWSELELCHQRQFVSIFFVSVFTLCRVFEKCCIVACRFFTKYVQTDCVSSYTTFGVDCFCAIINCFAWPRLEHLQYNAGISPSK